MYNSSLVYSGFALSTFISIIVVYFFVISVMKISQLYKFKKQEVNVYENKNVKYILLALFISYILFYIAVIILFALFVKNNLNSYIIAFEIIFLLLMIDAVFYIWLDSRWSTAIILVNKNNTLISSKDFINKEMITNIKTDKKRKYYLIDYRDNKIKNNINRMKIKYNWKLKDFLIENQYINKKESTNG